MAQKVRGMAHLHYNDMPSLVVQNFLLQRAF